MSTRKPGSRRTMAKGSGRLVCTAHLGGDHTFDIVLVRELLAADAWLREQIGNRRALLVVPTEVWAIYGPRIEAIVARSALDIRTLVLTIDESRKTLDTVASVCEQCHANGIGRADVLISFGGGVCSDIVTVAAGLVRRGIAHVRIPTTLVGQIDAGIGIKGGLNLHDAKSFLGVFHAPEAVLVDPAFLATSPRPSLLDGIAEMVKIATIADPQLFALVEDHGAQLLQHRFAGEHNLVDELLARAIRGMIDQLTPNFLENKTWLRLVDFGHTFSGAIEARSGYRTSHGQAVAIDMALSAAVGVTLGITEPAVQQRLTRLLDAVGLPIDSPLLDIALCGEAITSACLHRGGTPNLVVPRAIGDCTFVIDRASLSPSLVAAALDLLRRTRAGRPKWRLAGGE